MTMRAAVPLGRWTAGVIRAGVLLAVWNVAQADDTHWNYKSYKKSLAGYGDGNFIAGTLAIEEKDGRWYVQLSGGRMDACHKGPIAATVVRTAETTTVEEVEPLAGCEPSRYVINNDGSGGRKQTRRGDDWVNDKSDHGLTPIR